MINFMRNDLAVSARRPGASGMEVGAGQDISVETADPRFRIGWDEMVLSHPDATVFHTSWWAEVLCRTYGHRPFYQVIRRDRMLLAVLPVMEVGSRITGCRGVSLPFSDFCQPLIYEDLIRIDFNACIAPLAQKRCWRGAEIRGDVGPSFIPTEVFYVHKLRLDGAEEEIFARIDSAKRRAIRRAERAGVIIRISRFREAMREFFEMHVATRARHNMPTQPWTFFSFIYQELIQKGLGVIVTATKEGRAVAAAVIFKVGRKAVYKFAASTDAGRSFRANDLVVWEAVRWLRRNGAEELNFGRTGFADVGLRRFKSGFGASEEFLQYHGLPSNRGSRLSARLRSAKWSIPLFRYCSAKMNRRMGEWVYPHLD